MKTKIVIVAVLMAAALTGILSTTTMAAYAQPRFEVEDRLRETLTYGDKP